MQHLRFTRSACRAILLLCVLIAALLLYKHLSQDRRQTHYIQDLQARVAMLEREVAAQSRYAPASKVNIHGAPSETASGSYSPVASTQVPGSATRRQDRRSRLTGTASRPESVPAAQNAPASALQGSDVNFRETDTRSTETRSSNYVTKFKTPHTVELNTADSITLIRIPGIGAATAGAILRYRSRLGGYTSPRQVAEAAHWASASQVESWCRDWFSTDTALVVPLKINRATFSALLRHPYLSYAQVCAIFDLRRTQGRIRTLSELKMLPEFSEADFTRLTPYLSFQ